MDCDDDLIVAVLKKFNLNKIINKKMNKKKIKMIIHKDIS